jgi:hypothetical protein
MLHFALTCDRVRSYRYHRALSIYRQEFWALAGASSMNPTRAESYFFE